MSSFASSYPQPKSTFDFDVSLTYLCNDHEDGVRTFLEDCLKDAGFKTFIADISEVPTWKIIQRSRIVVVLITPQFVRSNLCLERLVKLKSDLKTVLHFFYWVNLNDLREQLISFYMRPFFKCGVRLCELSETYRLRFQAHDDSTRDSDPQHTADVVCSSLYGFQLSRHLSDQKAVINDLIAKTISQVGVQPRVREVLHRLGWESHSAENTTIVGIRGVAGIGKTTIAKAIYNGIGYHFNCKSFLANIKDVWDKKNGQVLLRKQLLSDFRTNHMKQGPYRRALIVLDDVNQVGQLIELCGNRKQFGKGSLIFITTRNKGLLDDFVDMSYEVERLDYSESLELFGRHAFKNFGLTNDFVNLSMKAITLCEGLPLILEVIGSILHTKTKSVWKKVLDKLENVPSGQIQHKLQISLDILADSEKKLFCHVARFHVGRRISDVIQLYEGLRFPIEMGMQVLIDHSFIKVVKGKIHVHDLLQETGRRITANKPKSKDIYDVFLSFRGEDTRKMFATHLYVALKQAGIVAFMDEEGIAKGEHIPSSLLHAIENSRLSIIIFSKNYAGSSWCLKELEKIMECHKTTNQKIFPIFYDVQPSDVRKQQNDFGEAWEQLITRPSSSKEKNLTNNWKRVLIEAANLSGWDMKYYRNEIELLDDVVKTMAARLARQ